MAGAVLRASRKGCGAPGRRGSCVWQAQYSEPLERVAARLVAAGQYSEPLERVAARLVAAGPRPVCAAGERLEKVAARLRGRRSTQSLYKGLRRAWSPPVRGSLCAILRASRKGAPGRRWSAAPVCVAGAVLGASRRVWQFAVCK